MEISPLSNMSQLAVAALPVKLSQSDPKIAFGIGQEKLVELSPQGKILQQTEQAQRERAASGAADAQPESQARAEQFSGYVRVSSSSGTTQRNNLSTEQATEVYRSIEKLL